ncbi:MAG: RES family NAD+ phosphorylase [Gammaproteobacteria bacterium]|nr:RES family NAD+ phosphorylase [Gammaproteobacteria bacterium]
MTEVLRDELLPESSLWWRLADPHWQNPLDPDFARVRGGRWNPPGSFPTLYLNEDVVTARLNLRAFIAAWPYEPEDLRDDTGPILVAVTLPRQQSVCDVHSREGVRAVGLPASYPFEPDGRVVPHTRCQLVGVAAKDAALRGVRARSAQSRDGVGRELAWFPATARSVAQARQRLSFDTWYYS